MANSSRAAACDALAMRVRDAPIHERNFQELSENPRMHPTELRPNRAAFKESFKE